MCLTNAQKCNGKKLYEPKLEILEVIKLIYLQTEQNVFKALTFIAAKPFMDFSTQPYSFLKEKPWTSILKKSNRRFH